MKTKGDKKGKEMLDRAYRYTALITGFFFVTAALGGILGKYFSERYGTKAIFITLGVFFVFSWVCMTLLTRKFFKKK